MLTLRELSLVSLGASIGANCIPCAVYHLKQCKKSNLSDDQIKAAIDAAVKVKNVPAENVFATLLRQLDEIEDIPCKGDRMKHALVVDSAAVFGYDISSEEVCV